MIDWVLGNRWSLLLVARFAISVTALFAGLVVARRWWDRLGLKSLIVYYAARLVLVWLLVEVFDMPPPDIACWGEVTIEPIMSGQYDAWSFPHVYYVGFVYFGVLLCRWFNSYFGLALMFAMAEFFAMLFLFGILRKVYNLAVAKKTIILYLSCPFGIIVSFLGAQDEPLIMLAMFAFIYFVLVRPNVVGRLLSILFGVLFTKILVLFYMFPVVLLRRFKGFFSLVAIFLLYFVARYAGPENILKVGATSNVLTLGNIWYMLKLVPGWFQFTIFATSIFLLSLSLAPNFLKDGISPRERLDAVMVISVCLHFMFVLGYRVCFAAYLLPMIPFLFVMMRHDVENKVAALARIVFVVWLFVAAFCDPFLYGVGPTSRNGVLVVASGVCVCVNVAMLICVVGKYRNLFYSPAEASSQLFAYCQRLFVTKR